MLVLKSRRACAILVYMILNGKGLSLAVVLFNRPILYSWLFLNKTCLFMYSDYCLDIDIAEIPLINSCRLLYCSYQISSKGFSAF